jgi:hypothetical protein
MEKEEVVTKLPFFKQWWFNLIIGVVIGAVLFGNIGGSNVAELPIEEDTTVEATADVPEVKEEVEVKVEKPEEEREEEKEPVEVYSDEKVTISFVKIDEKGVKFIMENNTEKELTVQANSVAINGFSTDKITMSDSVSPKSKGFVIAKTDELENVGEPKVITGQLRIIDFSGDWDTYDAAFMEIPVK